MSRFGDVEAAVARFVPAGVDRELAAAALSGEPEPLAAAIGRVSDPRLSLMSEVPHASEHHGES